MRRLAARLACALTWRRTGGLTMWPAGLPQSGLTQSGLTQLQRRLCGLHIPRLLRHLALAVLASSACTLQAAPITLVQAPFDGRVNLHPTVLLVLDLSGSALLPAWSGHYQSDLEYQGYFNALQCYRWSGAADETAYFTTSSATSQTHECAGDAFSGNFLNWASMSMLDMLRMGMTGGSRAVDTSTTTVLARADTGASVSAQDAFRRRVGIADRVAVNRITPYTGTNLYVIACGARLRFAATLTENGCDVPASAQNTLGDFPVRVAVCDAADAAQRSWYCRRFGTSFKPQGQLQRYGGQLRIALLAMAGDRPRLLAPAAYSGPDRFDPPGLLSSENTYSQWDRTTGVQSNASGSDSTVPASARLLQWVDQFAPTPGSHNGDGRMLYRGALDYLRDPGSAGVAVSDPIVAGCQKNIVAMISDQWYGSGIDQPAPTAAHQSVLREPIRQVRAIEADSDGRFNNPTPRATEATLTPMAALMGGIGYQANTKSLRPGAEVRATTFAIDIDAAGNGERAQADSPLFVAARYGGFDDWNGDGNPFVSDIPAQADWPSNAGIESDRNGDGIPDNYSRARNGNQLLSSITRLFARISATTAPGSTAEFDGDAVSGATISTTGSSSVIYRAGYETRSWSGSLRKFSITADQHGRMIQSATPLWRASIPAPAQRKIFTAVTAEPGGHVTLPLVWDRLPADSQSIFQGNPYTGAADGLGSRRLAWAAGESSAEIGIAEVGIANGGMRRRYSLLGDVINSNVVLSVAPAAGNPDAAYQSFADANRERPTAVFVGANDGMLHAFDAGTGAEIFAFLPAALLGKLPQLSSLDYVHAAFVDGGISVADAKIGEQWKTVLAASFGRGAAGLFALDVSDPAQFGSGPGSLWEFTQRDDADIGHVLSAPQIVRLGWRYANGIVGERHFVLVQGGVNGGGAVFLLALDKEAQRPWARNVNYFKFSVSTDSADTQYGLGPLTLLMANDGRLASAYAGDLNGALWRFSFALAEPRSGLSLQVAVQRIFSARDGSGNAQPITTAPRVAYAPGKGYLVLVGTGKMLEAADAAAGSFSVPAQATAPAVHRLQSYYAVHDTLSTGAAVSRANLAVREAVRSASSNNYQLRGTPFSYGGDIRGWYLDLPVAGERVIASSVISSRNLYFSSAVIPSDPCAALSHREWSVDLLSGLSMASTGNSFAGRGLSTPLVMTTASNAAAQSALGRQTWHRSQAIQYRPPATVQNGDTSAAFTSTLPSGRLGWQEIGNWIQLRERSQANQ